MMTAKVIQLSSSCSVITVALAVLSSTAAPVAPLSLNKDVVKADVTVLRESLTLTFDVEVEDEDAVEGKNVRDVVNDNDAFVVAVAAVVIVVEVVAVNNNEDEVVDDDDEDDDDVDTDEASLAAFVKILCIAGDVIKVEGNFVDSTKVAAAVLTFSVLKAALIKIIKSETKRRSKFWAHNNIQSGITQNQGILGFK
ncbi:hypothetical protein FF38_11897 [Lucilia cuprina]|uniref:Uncharacterized protein n=1 Tax=Lucilia cuprina TaxID=7375 RepID=A0A0L0BYB2_LUCCU|nr:hypothetical protein FF38_11897 [Lucilia cuprina]